MTARRSSSEESCTVAQKNKHDVSEHIFTRVSPGRSRDNLRRGVIGCVMWLTRNKSEGINGTPIQHHKIQHLRASLFSAPIDGPGSQPTDAENQTFVCDSGNRTVCVVGALVRPSAASPPNECYRHEDQAVSVGSRSAWKLKVLPLLSERLYPASSTQKAHWPRPPS